MIRKISVVYRDGKRGTKVASANAISTEHAILTPPLRHEKLFFIFTVYILSFSVLFDHQNRWVSIAVAVDRRRKFERDGTRLATNFAIARHAA